MGRKEAEGGVELGSTICIKDLNNNIVIQIMVEKVVTCMMDMERGGLKMVVYLLQGQDLDLEVGRDIRALLRVEAAVVQALLPPKRKRRRKKRNTRKRRKDQQRRKSVMPVLIVK